MNGASDGTRGADSARWFWWAVALVVGVWALAYLPCLGTRDLRLEEGRRATPTAEMFYTGDYVVPRLYGQPYLNKPPLFFWMSAGIGALQGRVNQLSVRIPSALSALAGALALLGFARRQLPLRVRLTAALMFLSMPIMLDKGTLGEIDAVLSLFSFAAMAILWEAFDEERGRFRFWGWVGAGVALALATLVKGPGGMLEFYGMLVPFLVLSGRKGEHRWVQLFGPGHLLMLAMSIVPAVLWVVAVCDRTHLTLAQLAGLWRQQTGMDAVGMLATGKEVRNLRLQEHYLYFGIRAVAQVLPWLLFALPLYLPGGTRKFIRKTTNSKLEAPRAGNRSDLAWLLVPGLPVLILFFWIWPNGNPRYLMMEAYPVSVLAAWAAWEALGSEAWQGRMGLWRAIGNWAAGALVVGSVGAVVVAVVSRAGVATAVVSGVGCVAVVAACWKWRNLPGGNSPWVQGGAAIWGIALAVALGRGLVAVATFPKLAARDSTRILHQQIEAVVPKGQPVYTTRTFSSKRGDEYYNMQFYLPRAGGGPRGLDDLRVLSREEGWRFGGSVPVEKVTVLISEEDWASLEAVAPGARRLGKLFAPKGPPAVTVAEVYRNGTEQEALAPAAGTSGLSPASAPTSRSGRAD